jgi:hypothetical protein
LADRTGFLLKCRILNDLWLNHREDETFKEFISEQDLALPIAHLFLESIVFYTPRGGRYVEEAFEWLLVLVGVEDSGFESLEELLTKKTKE